MKKDELEGLLQKLIAEWESELVEFKQSLGNKEVDKIGRYFSALSNEANLRGFSKAWLVFGVNDKTRKVVGTDFRVKKEKLQSLKLQIKVDTEPSVTFREIHELETSEGRVLLFEIPSAPQGLPIAWKGHRHARAGESLVALGDDKTDEIRSQTKSIDWSVQTVEEAKVSDLSKYALELAREYYVQKQKRLPENVIREWSTETFLERIRLSIDGKLTRAAILLLGKPESSHLLSPHPAQITWKLQDGQRAYEHFGLPFLLTTTEVYQKIRNFEISILPEGSLLAIRQVKYEQKMILEALHNCVAHQDYIEESRILVVEYADKILFESCGSFYDGSPEDYVPNDKTPRRYRNLCLTEAMTELNMIDKMGYGIFSMNQAQAKRYLPLPDYDLIEEDFVRLTIYGAMIDPLYSRLLISQPTLSLNEIWALDRIQKKKPLADDLISLLRKKKLIEGRKPNLYISSWVVRSTGSKTEYISSRAEAEIFYMKLILDYIKESEQASRTEINELLWDNLPDGLDDKQKVAKVANLLTKLRKKRVIKNIGSRKRPKWVLHFDE